jgi:hypothetical protein
MDINSVVIAVGNPIDSLTLVKGSAMDFVSGTGFEENRTPL